MANIVAGLLTLGMFVLVGKWIIDSLHWQGEWRKYKREHKDD